jgi:hypothetical protein
LRLVSFPKKAIHAALHGHSSAAGKIWRSLSARSNGGAWSKPWPVAANCRSLEEGGVLAALAGDGRPHGIAAFRIEQGLVHGRTLKVEPMVTFEINRSSPVRAALCETLELLAVARRCETLLIANPCRGYADPAGAKAAAWAELGFELATVNLARRLVPVQATGLAVL